MKTQLTQLFSQDFIRLVLSNPKNNDAPYKKINLKKVLIKNEIVYQLEAFTDKQAFHFNYTQDEALEQVAQYFENHYRQCDLFCREMNYLIKQSKKGKLLIHKHRATNEEITDHNRQKQYLLQEGVFIEPLYDLGIFTKEGKVVRSMYDKYKQINRYLEMINDVLPKNATKLSIIDFGCGKSYLTFIVYYYLTVIKKLKVRMIGLDLKAEVIKNCNTIAQKYGYTNLTFEIGDINGYQTSFPIDMVISLHACDTATDYALYNAIQWNAKIILAVPCCQHELNKQISSQNLSILTRYGLVKERTAALMTDAIRANLLDAVGYDTQLLEFIDISHSPKNILIRAVRNDSKLLNIKKGSLDEVKSLMQSFSIEPKLYTLLEAELKKI